LEQYLGTPTGDRSEAELSYSIQPRSIGKNICNAFFFFFDQQRIKIIKMGHFRDVPTRIHQIGAPDLEKNMYQPSHLEHPKNY